MAIDNKDVLFKQRKERDRFREVKPEFHQNQTAEQMENSSPKNSFCKTESELKPRHLPEYLEGRTPKRKMSFPFSEKIGRAQIRNARNIFLFGVRRGSARRWRGDSPSVRFSFKPPRAPRVRHHLFWK